MTRIIHLSDPHFGTEDPALLQPLCAWVAGARPDVVVLSGDLTQRARPAQFAAAARFIAALPAPVLAIPGNHDTPLGNLALRLFRPWYRYHNILPELEPVVDAGTARIVGVNTANPLVWKDGRITPAQLDRLHRTFEAAPDRRRIVAMHHPIEGPPGEPRSLSGATEAAAAFAAMGVEIVLSGHLHFTYAAPLSLAPDVLSVQAGTCVSTRTRSDGNAFTMLDLGDSAVTLTHIRAQPDKSFRADADWTLRQEGGRWTAPGL